MLVGAEPDHSWRAFTAAVLDLALRFGTRMVVGLGAYPAAVPHTRPTMLSVTASTDDLASQWPFLRGTLDVPGRRAGRDRARGGRRRPARARPVGAGAALHVGDGLPRREPLAHLGHPGRWPRCSLPAGTLDEEADEARARLDQIIAGNEEHARMVAALEHEADSTADQNAHPLGRRAGRRGRAVPARAGPRPVTIAACTVVTRNHLAFARIAGRSWLDHHRGSTFTIVVVDHDRMPPPSWIHRDIRIVGPDALGVDTEELHRRASIYSAVELACSLKPAAIELVLDDADVAVYLDGDIEVLDSMGGLEDLADRARRRAHPPHAGPTARRRRAARPLHDARRRRVQRRARSRSAATVIPFLSWWADRLRRDAIEEPRRGMHLDQRWLDQVPSYFDHHVLRDPTYNLAYWNLHERPTSWDGETLWVGAPTGRSASTTPG